MAMFTTRIVLKDAEWDDYAGLHQLMAAQGFTKDITSNDGIVYALPDAEYNLVGNFTIDDAYEKAKAAANGTKLKYAILVSQATRRKWSGLDQI